jgi:ferrous iron transport protein A
MTNMSQLPPGSTGKIRGFQAELRPEIGRRLRELGFVDGNVVRCVRRAPFGGPRVYAVSGAAFALEREVAVHVLLGAADNDDGLR